jgi:hypothetical protein
VGAYAACWLDDCVIGATKSGADPNLMDLFRSTDRVVVNERGWDGTT